MHQEKRQRARTAIRGILQQAAPHGVAVPKVLSRFHIPALFSRVGKQDGQPRRLTQMCSVSFYNLLTLLAPGRKGIIQRGIV